MAHKLVPKILKTVLRFEEQGKIGKEASAKLRKKLKLLERAIATKDNKLIRKTIVEISEILYEDLQR